jgi:hypothetical protein
MIPSDRTLLSQTPVAGEPLKATASRPRGSNLTPTF